MNIFYSNICFTYIYFYLKCEHIIIFLADSSNTTSPQQSDLIPNELNHTTIISSTSSTSRPQSPYQNVLLHSNHHAFRRDDASGVALLAELGVRTSSESLVQSEELSRSDTPRGETQRKRKNNAELRQMESCTRSLLSVVNNMITYYKVDMAVAPILMPVQLRTLLKEVCGYFETCVEEGVVFSHEVRDIVPQTVIADANLLRHVLANLVSNALRFTNKGAVTVVVDVVEPAPSVGMPYPLPSSSPLLFSLPFSLSLTPLPTYPQMPS